MDKNYSVVEFLLEKSVALVPKRWLFDNNCKCYWPPYKSVKLKQSVKDLHPANPSTWKTFSIRLLRSLDDYNKGLELARQAEVTSNLESESDYESPPRPQSRIPRLRSTTQRQSDTDYTRTVEARQTQEQYSEPLVEEHEFQISSYTLISNSDTSTSTVSAPLNEVSVQLLNQQNDSTVDNVHSLRGASNDGQDYQNVVLEIQQTSTENSPYNGLRQEITVLRELVANQLVHLKEGVQDLGKVHKPLSSSNYAELMILLPLNTENELRNFWEWTSIERNYCTTIRYLASLGGDNLNQVVRLMLMKIFARHFAILVNFVGANKKIKFRDTKTHCLMIDAVRHALSTEVTERQINIAIQNWFRGSKDRYGGRKRPRVCEQENHQAETNLSATRYDSESNTLQ